MNKIKSSHNKWKAKRTENKNKEDIAQEKEKKKMDWVRKIQDSGRRAGGRGEKPFKFWFDVDGFFVSVCGMAHELSLFSLTLILSHAPVSRSRSYLQLCRRRVAAAAAALGLSLASHLVSLRFPG
jgi:hypothetical protein